MANDELMRLAAKWRSENGDYPESKRDCADELERALAQRAPLHGAVPEEVNEWAGERKKHMRGDYAYAAGWNACRAAMLAAAPAPDQYPDAGKMVGESLDGLPINDAVPAPTEIRPGNLFLWNWRAMQQYGRACIAHAASASAPEAERAEGERYGVHEIRDLSKWIEAPFAVARHGDDVLVAHCTHRDSAEQIAAALNGQPNMVMPLDQAIRVGNEMLARANGTPPAGQPEGAEALLRSENPDRKDFSVAEALRLADQNDAAYRYVPSVSRTLAAEVRRLASAQRAEPDNQDKPQETPHA